MRAGDAPEPDRVAARELLERTRVDPLALAAGAAVLAIIAFATWVALLHGAHGS